LNVTILHETVIKKIKFANNLQGFLLSLPELHFIFVIVAFPYLFFYVRDFLQKGEYSDDNVLYNINILIARTLFVSKSHDKSSLFKDKCRIYGHNLKKLSNIVEHISPHFNLLINVSLGIQFLGFKQVNKGLWIRYQNLLMQC